MQESPLQLCKHLAAQWDKVSSTLYLEDDFLANVNLHLRELEGALIIANDYQINRKTLSGEYAACEFGCALEDASKNVDLLIKDAQHAKKVWEQFDANKTVRIDAEEASLLLVLTMRCGQALGEFHDYNLPIRKKRSMHTFNDGPQYPTYPANLLSMQQSLDLAAIRKSLLAIRLADAAIDAIPADSPDRLRHALTAAAKAAPSVASLINGSQNIDELNIRLQKEFNARDIAGVLLMTDVYSDIDLAETAMETEIDAIDKYISQNKKSVKVASP